MFHFIQTHVLVHANKSRLKSKTKMLEIKAKAWQASARVTVQ